MPNNKESYRSVFLEIKIEVKMLTDRRTDGQLGIRKAPLPYGSGELKMARSDA